MAKDRFKAQVKFVERVHDQREGSWDKWLWQVIDTSVEDAVVSKGATSGTQEQAFKRAQKAREMVIQARRTEEWIDVP